MNLTLEEMLLLSQTPSESTDKSSIVLKCDSILRNSKIDYSRFNQILDSLLACNLVERSNQQYRITTEGTEQLRRNFLELDAIVQMMGVT